MDLNLTEINSRYLGKKITLVTGMLSRVYSKRETATPGNVIKKWQIIVSGRYKVITVLPHVHDISGLLFLSRLWPGERDWLFVLTGKLVG